jgi:hypothetical protein
MVSYIRFRSAATERVGCEELSRAFSPFLRVIPLSDSAFAVAGVAASLGGIPYKSSAAHALHERHQTSPVRLP